MNEIQKADKKRLRKVSSVTTDGAIIYKPMHRNCFNRSVARPNYEQIKPNRFYFQSVDEFNEALQLFNSRPDKLAEYHGVGYANVRLHLCESCFDISKALPLDMYFVNRTKDSSLPRNLCLGCLGVLLRDYEQSLEKPKFP